MNFIDVPSAPKPIGHFSHAVIANGFLFASGQGPIDPVTEAMPSGIAGQTVATLNNLRAVLQAAGADLNDVVRFGIYLRNPQDFKRFNEAYLKILGNHRPARTTICPPLLGDILIEIDCIAVLPKAVPD